LIADVVGIGRGRTAYVPDETILGQPMRLGLRITGTLLIVGSLLGLVGLGVVLLLPEHIATAPIAAVGHMLAASQIGHAAQANQTRPGGGPARQAASGSADARGLTDPDVLDTLNRLDTLSARAAPGAAGMRTGTTRPDAQSVAFRPITHLAIPSVDLSADVVPAGLIERDGGFTWEVPAFKVGHAETTAGAGQPGNGVLLGHVTSLRSGNVFGDLDRVQIGDGIQISADADQFAYRVVSKTRVPRSDSAVLEQGEVPAVSLITCTGVWLPTIWDYTERLVVRAELVDTR
jgi:LPXTG-site transpeptidase (sortase) family protein